MLGGDGARQHGLGLGYDWPQGRQRLGHLAGIGNARLAQPIKIDLSLPRPFQLLRQLLGGVADINRPIAIALGRPFLRRLGEDVAVFADESEAVALEFGVYLLAC